MTDRPIEETVVGRTTFLPVLFQTFVSLQY